MRKNCFIDPKLLTEESVSRDNIEVDTETLSGLTDLSVSTLRAWASIGLFENDARRQGSGTGTGTYYLFKLSCVDRCAAIRSRQKY